VKHVILGLLCLVVLLPASAIADSLDSITPSSFFQFDIEQSATLTGVNLFGNVFGPPDDTNIFASTSLQIDGPTGTFIQSIAGGFRDPGSGVDTIFMTIFDSTLALTGTYSVTVIATDTAGYRAIGPVFYNVVARPVVPQNPLIFVPEVVFASATGADGATVQFSVSGFSFVDPAPAPTITCDHQSGDLFPLGGTNVTCTATDSFGSASASFPVFVMDTVGPVVTVPSDILVASQTDAVVTFTATAVDAIAGSVGVTCFPESGSTFPLGTTVVTCIALDEQDNPGFGQFNVTVSAGPVLTLPPNLTVECTSPSGAPVSFTPTSTDNATIVCTPASGSTFPLGTTTDNCTATAVTGTASGSFTVTVLDTTPPSISSVTATPNSLWPPDKTMVPVTIGVSVTDVCSSNPAGRCQIISVSSNEPDGTTQWQITGPLTLNLKADRFGTHVPGTPPGSGGRIYTITVRCTDGSGNASTKTVTVTVPHDQGP
jgi:HYR domain